METFDRVKLLIGEENYQKLKDSRVAIFGVGGVGGYVAEALARSGVGNLTILDNDKVAKSNLNRQIIATTSVLGKDKVEVLKGRLESINPEIKVTAEKVFYLPENADNYDLSKYDYIVDAVDTVTAKLEIIERAKKSNVKVSSKKLLSA
jgi:tRNA A37 threonylcarbamoyladenosine dehydratase